MQGALKRHDGCCRWCGLQFSVHLNQYWKMLQDERRIAVVHMPLLVYQASTQRCPERCCLRAEKGGASRCGVITDLQGEAEGLAAPASICIVQAATLRLQVQHLRGMTFSQQDLASTHWCIGLLTVDRLLPELLELGGLSSQGHVRMHEQKASRCVFRAPLQPRAEG